jgi:hypothetical protein
MQASVFNFQIGKSVHLNEKKKYFGKKPPENIYSADRQLKNKLKNNIKNVI